MNNLKLFLFFKLFIITITFGLITFGLTDLGLLETAKVIALGTAVSIIIAYIYPEIRGIRKGDRVTIVSNSEIPGILGKFGYALTEGKKNMKIRVQLKEGEIVGKIDNHGGILSPPKVIKIYEESLIE